jgi:hypothetical protein
MSFSNLRNFIYELQGCQSGRRSLMAAAELCSAVSTSMAIYLTITVVSKDALSYM